MTKPVTAGAQGDILIVPCATIPQNAVLVAPENGRLIVARGEATGHHHSFAYQRGATLFRDDGSGGGYYLRVTEPAALEHQEHAQIVFAPGTYRVVRQRTMQTGMVQRVVD